MSYEPTNWKSGDTVTSAKLNKIEQGIANAGGGGGVLKVGVDAQTMALDETYAEIANADYAVISVPEQGGGVNYGLLVYSDDANYTVIFWMAGNEMTFVADSADGYPVYSH